MSRQRCPRPVESDDQTPTAIESEQVLMGALVCGLHVAEIRRAITPGQLFRRDHELILREAFVLADRGVTPDARLIDGTIGARLDNRADLYRLADYSVGLTPDRIAEHARRIQAAALARRYLAAFALAGARLREDPAAVLNGLPVDLARTLEALRAETPNGARVSETLPELAARLADNRTRDLLVGDLLALGEIAMLHGQPRDGKTWIALDLAMALATGTRACGLDRLAVSEARRVLLVGNEDGAARYLERLQLLAAGRGRDIPETVLLLVGRGVSLDETNWQLRLIDEIRREAIALLILDPLRSVTAAADQGPAELYPVAQYLRRLIGETSCAVLICHHDTKPQAGVTDTRRRAQRASGGGVFSIVDAPMHVERAGETRTLITPDGTKHAPDAAPIIVDRTSGEGWVRLVGQTTTVKAASDLELHAAITEYLRRSGGASGRAVAQAIRRRRDDTNSALEALCAAGVVDQADGPRRARLWCLR